MKKVWIGVGIGCGTLLLIGLGLIIAGGIFVSKAVQSTADFSQHVQAQEKELASIDARYAFTPPPAGHPLKLETARVEKYFAVRDALKPAYARFEEKSKALQGKKTASVSDVMSATKMFAEVATDARAALIESLKKQEMSRREFSALTTTMVETTLNPPDPAATKARREELKQTIAAVEKKLAAPSLPKEEKEALDDELSSDKSELESLPPDDPASAEIYASNAKLMEPYKERFEQGYNPVLDEILGMQLNNHPHLKRGPHVRAAPANDGDNDDGSKDDDKDDDDKKGE